MLLLSKAKVSELPSGWAWSAIKTFWFWNPGTSLEQVPGQREKRWSCEIKKFPAFVADLEFARGRKCAREHFAVQSWSKAVGVGAEVWSFEGKKISVYKLSSAEKIGVFSCYPSPGGDVTAELLWRVKALGHCRMWNKSVTAGPNLPKVLGVLIEAQNSQKKCLCPTVVGTLWPWGCLGSGMSLTTLQSWVMWGRHVNVQPGRKMGEILPCTNPYFSPRSKILCNFI